MKDSTDTKRYNSLLLTYLLIFLIFHTDKKQTNHSFLTLEQSHFKELEDVPGVEKVGSYEHKNVDLVSQEAFDMMREREDKEEQAPPPPMPKPLLVESHLNPDAKPFFIPEDSADK